MKITIRQDDKQETVIEIKSPADSTGAVAEFKYEEILDWIFRQLNRVNGQELISLLHLRIPSLSVGDIVQIEQRTWRCESVGWREL